MRDKETCLSSLRSLIDADSFYFYLAQKDKNFEPLTLEIGNWLKEINANASNEAEREIAKAEESVNEAEEALRKYPSKEKLFASSIGLLESAKSELGSAKSKVALENYRASLDAIYAAEAACRFANRAKEEAGEKLRYYKNELTKILNELLRYAPLAIVKFGIVGSMGGCVLGVFSSVTFEKVMPRVVSDFILGVIVGAIFAIGRTIRDLHDIDKTKL